MSAVIFNRAPTLQRKCRYSQRKRQKMRKKEMEGSKTQTENYRVKMYPLHAVWNCFVLPGLQCAQFAMHPVSSTF